MINYRKVATADRLPNKDGYYFTPDCGTLFYLVKDKQWWYDGNEYFPSNWLEEVEDNNDLSDGYHTMRELYEHRIVLFIALCAQIHDRYTWEDKPVWRTKIKDGWFILGIGIKSGEQITYHLPESKWHDTEFARDVNDTDYVFDGHTSADVLKRVRAM